MILSEKLIECDFCYYPAVAVYTTSTANGVLNAACEYHRERFSFNDYVQLTEEELEAEIAWRTLIDQSSGLDWTDCRTLNRVLTIREDT